jgi:glycosyltransferase involved in cell wall biosynthesis
MSKKKKILFQTDSALAKTGFGRTAKALLTYLYKTGKYDITHYALGMNVTHLATHKTPWKTVGCLPDDQREMQDIQKDPTYARQVNYGALYLDQIIEQEKPDLYFAMQDIWGVDYVIEKKWFDKITSVIWTTLDSLPILPVAVEKASKIKNYWIWSSFATKALHELGHEHVKTVHGPVESSAFKKLSDQKKARLRLNFEKYIPINAFVVGFVFRNQLRKSVPNLMEGYSLFKKRLPKDQPTRLLLHTSFSEGWGILKLAEEYGVPQEDIITTYVCKSCKRYAVINFVGEDQKCPYCHSEKTFSTSGVGSGVSEEELNEIYNLMDVYCHPFTSGGQEIPIQEAKLVELITLVTNYSCGEEMCDDAAESLPLEWSEYREHQTHFKKASTDPRSIAKQLKKVFQMKSSRRTKMGEKARRWALENYSVDIIGAQIEKFIDDAPFADYDLIDLKQEEKDPHAEIPPEPDDSKWLSLLYKYILKRDIDATDQGHEYWISELKKGKQRREVDLYFRKVAIKHNTKNSKDLHDKDLGDFTDDDDAGRRILYVMPGSIGDVFMSTALFKSLNELYPDYNLYVATTPECNEILDGNPYVHKVIPFLSYMENLQFLEGSSKHKGWFEVAFIPYVNTQNILTYMHNGKDKVAYKDLKYED